MAPSKRRRWSATATTTEYGKAYFIFCPPLSPQRRHAAPFSHRYGKFHLKATKTRPGAVSGRNWATYARLAEQRRPAQGSIADGVPPAPTDQLRRWAPPTTEPPVSSPAPDALSFGHRAPELPPTSSPVRLAASLLAEPTSANGCDNTEKHGLKTVPTFWPSTGRHKPNRYQPLDQQPAHREPYPTGAGRPPPSGSAKPPPTRARIDGPTRWPE